MHGLSTTILGLLLYLVFFIASSALAFWWGKLCYNLIAGLFS